MLIHSLAIFLYSGLSFAASYPVLTYSTYLRDNFTPKAIATDSAGNIYMAGNAVVDASLLQTTMLVVKLNPQATQYLYVRYFGGSVDDYANAITVDKAGNAYIAGATASPDFPITTGGNLAIAPAGVNNQRSFLVKLDPNGELIFSDLLGGSAGSAAQAVAVNSAGQIVVSGAVSNAGGGPTFPSTTGAYSVANTTNHPYLLELDPTGTKIIFSATGIGGSALAFDPSGNIYVAGTTYLLDYPTTPGAYQPAFPAFMTCFSICQLEFQGANQYVTKVDPTGSKLLYSTSVSGTDNTANGGLAVDPAGDVYLTGVAGRGYPYTVTIPSTPINPAFGVEGLPFVTKLDPTGAKLLFSVPIGGAGIQLDANGAVYVGGGLGVRANSNIFSVTTNLPGLTIPAACLPDPSNTAYVAQLDASSGNILGSQFIGGSTLIPSAVALSGSTLWITGATDDASVPFTPNALTLPNLTANPPAGAYLGAVDFSQPQPPSGTPQIGCIIDAADFAPIGPAARYQLLTIVGTGLGPATGVTAPDNSTTSLGGVTVNFGAVPAPLLYVSSTQINLAVPLVTLTQSFSPMQITVNGVNAPPLALPLTYANPSLFLNAAQTSQNLFNPIALALNADGSVNSSTNPAQLGSKISVFINGLTSDPQVTTAPPQFSTDFAWSVTDFVQATPFVIRVDLKTPTALIENYGCAPPSNLCIAGFALLNSYYESVGPQSTPSGGQIMAAWVFINSPFN